MTGKKTAVVTGGAGFIGSRLCARLLEEGYRVISLDNYFAGSKESHVAGVDYREGHTKDIALHIDETPDIIFHLGEYSRVEQSLLEPDVVHDLNVLGTEGVIRFWKEKKCTLVYAGSSTKFGDGGLARDATPYAKSKADNTEKVKATGDALGLPYAITYFYNVFGPGERSGAYGTVIEMFRQMYLRGAPITVTSPGTQTRNFTHVDDIVDGLVLVGEKGAGDEYGLGNEKMFSMIEVGRLFSEDIVMLPERAGNRMTSSLDTTKSRGLGWAAERRLEDYIQMFLDANPRGTPRERRVLVFSTTFFPVSGPAEDALLQLIREMPQIHFDIVTAAFTKDGKSAESPVNNATIYRVGNGTPLDKFLLPFLGLTVAAKLYRTHAYLFAWSIFASYAALGALILKRLTGVPLLITLADQDLDAVPAYKRWFLARMLSDADQVYGIESKDERKAARLAKKTHLRRSMGTGDAFANQIRFIYANLLKAGRSIPKKKKILIFSLAYIPHIGGAEIAMKEITDRIPDTEFHMVTLRFDTEAPQKERIGNILVFRVGNGKGYFSKMLFLLASVFKARALHREHRYDGMWAMMSYMLVPIMLLRLTGIRLPYALTLQEGDPFEHMFERPHVALLKPLLVAGFQKASVIQTISTFLAGWAKRFHFKGPIEVIPNGVDTARFAREYSAREIQETADSLGKNMGDVYLITTSRLVHKNAVDDLISSLASLPENVHALVLGTGSDEVKLRALSKKLSLEGRVHFIGQVGHDELPKYLKASDIFVRASRSEGMGNSFIEAMAAGLPVVATQEGGISDFLFDEKRNPGQPVTGWAVSKNAPQEIAAVVKDIMSHPEKMRGVVRTARALALQNYDWTLIAKSMQEKVFSRL